jgi:hypothetical protein
MNDRLPSVPPAEPSDSPESAAAPLKLDPATSEAPSAPPPEAEDDENEPEEEEEAEEKRAGEARESRKEPSFWEFMKRNYASADPRSLGLLRIALGTLLFVDLARRIPDIEAHYANTGWLTNHFMLFRPMSSHLFSLYLAASTPGEVKVFFAVHLFVYLLFVVGYRTRLMHVLSLVLLVSVNSRNIAVENGGWVVLILLTTWSVFLPLGQRFSVDALRASLKARREGTELALNDRSSPAPSITPVVSLAVAALILQWATIYYFNVVHKTGPEWKNGTAVYYFFQQDRMVTWWGGFIRDYIPMWGYKAMTYGALTIESMVTVLLISPVASHKTRMVAWLLVCTLHLSIDSVVQLGPFSYAMMTMFFALIPAGAWQVAGEKLSARRREVTLEFNPKSTFALEICRWVKRLDTLEKVTFSANPEIKGLRVVRDGAEHLNVDAFREVARSFPMPFFWRAVTRAPFLGKKLALGLQKPKSASAYLGIEKLVGRDELAPEPSAVRRFFRQWTWPFRELAVLIVMISCASQVLIENRAVPKWLKPERRPDWMEAIVIYPRLFQGWSMFAPSPPTDDGRLVVDGVTKDGRRFDPLTGQAPDFDIQPKGGFRMNQIWGDFSRRFFEDRFKTYWNGFRDFLRNHHQITGRPEDELQAFDVYWVSEWIPLPGQPRKPPERKKLFSYGDVSHALGKQRPSVPGPARAGSKE